MRRDVIAMLFWTLRWHEGRRVSCRNLADVLWGDFGSKPQDAAGSVRELMGWVKKRHGDNWDVQNCDGKAFRILPRAEQLCTTAKMTIPPPHARRGEELQKTEKAPSVQATSLLLLDRARDAITGEIQAKAPLKRGRAAT